MNKKGASTDGFLLLIFVFIIAFMCGIFIYFGSVVYPAISDSISSINLDTGDVNKTKVVDDTIGEYSQSLTLFQWLSTLMIIGLFISYLIGCYLVTTKPVFIVPYIIISILVVIASVFFSNAYEQFGLSDIIGDTFLSMNTTAWIMAYLPLVTSIVFILGMIITFSNLGNNQPQEQLYYGI